MEKEDSGSGDYDCDYVIAWWGGNSLESVYVLLGREGDAKIA